MTIELTQDQLDEMVDGRVKDALAAFSKKVDEDNAQSVDLSQIATAFNLDLDAVGNGQITKLDEMVELAKVQANLQFQQKLANLERENRYTELSVHVTGGSQDAPRGIPADSDVLKAELMKLDADGAKFWAGLLEATVKNGLTDFAELGHGRKVKTLRQVPEYAQAELGRIVKAGVPAQKFFDASGLGSAEDYDLSGFEGEK